MTQHKGFRRLRFASLPLSLFLTLGALDWGASRQVERLLFATLCFILPAAWLASRTPSRFGVGWEYPQLRVKPAIGRVQVVDFTGESVSWKPGLVGNGLLREVAYPSVIADGKMIGLASIGAVFDMLGRDETCARLRADIEKRCVA